jgi:hypothetical protein
MMDTTTRVGEEPDLLDEADISPQPPDVDIFYPASINRDGAALRSEPSLEKADNGAFPRSTRPDNGRCFVSWDGKVETFQDGDIRSRWIGKLNTLENDISSTLRRCDALGRKGIYLGLTVDRLEQVIRCGRGFRDHHDLWRDLCQTLGGEKYCEDDSTRRSSAGRSG